MSDFEYRMVCEQIAIGRDGGYDDAVIFSCLLSMAEEWKRRRLRHGISCGMYNAYRAAAIGLASR